MCEIEDNEHTREVTKAVFSWLPTNEIDYESLGSKIGISTEEAALLVSLMRKKISDLLTSDVVISD